MKKLFVFLLLSIVLLNAKSQDAVTKNVCDQIFYFSNNITFPDYSTISVYKIAVYGKGSAIFTNLTKNYAGKTIHGKKITITNITKTKDLYDGYSIIYIDKQKNKSLQEIYQALEDKPTLIFTLDATNENYFMVNLRGDAKSYDVQSLNMIDKGFFVPEKILAVGGSKIDLQKLYSIKVNQLNTKVKQLNLKDKELSDKEKLLNNKDSLLVIKQLTLDSLTGVVKIEKVENEKKEKLLNLKDLDLKNKQIQIQKQAEAINLQNIKIKFQTKIIIITVISTIIFLMLSLIIYYQLRVNKRITAQLKQSNEEINSQKDQIEEQSKEIEQQRDIAVERGDKIARQHKEIQDSINTAVRIQRALLPETDFLNNIFAEHFITYKPRDVVSGDFYWTIRKNDKTLVVAADCTGHGVPGAMMSMLGMSFLNQITESVDNPETHKILVELSNLVINSLKQDISKELRSKEGIDLSMIVYDPKNSTIHYAGANNSIYIVTNEQPEILEGFEEYRIQSMENSKYKLFEIQADDRPIGIYYSEPQFVTKKVKVKKDSCIYMFSDGFPDLFNFQKRKKLGSKRFKDILIENAAKPLLEQQQAIETEYTTWLAEFRQVDDILIIGLKI